MPRKYYAFIISIFMSYFIIVRVLQKFHLNYATRCSFGDDLFFVRLKELFSKSSLLREFIINKYKLVIVMLE